MNWEQRISAEDALCASAVATTQMLRKHTEGRNGDHGGHSERGWCARWGNTWNGMMGEIALSRLLNMAWTPGGQKVSRGDVGFKLEARTTEWQNGHLLIYPEDKDASFFVLMVGHYPYYRAIGYMLGSDAKRDEYWRKSDPPCWWVPQEFPPLISMDLIPREPAGE
jgi:hypothetical protein